jgi:hypothetical protein
MRHETESDQGEIDFIRIGQEKGILNELYRAVLCVEG